jgi:hypothetical protein
MKQFFVKGIDDKTCTINYNNETYFEKVYLKLEKRYCISRNYFWLRFHKQINPNILVSSIIYPGATVFMVGKINSDIVEDIVVVRGKSFSFPREMFMESGILRQYYLNLIPKINKTKKTIKLNNILSNSKIKLLGNGKDIFNSFDHFYNFFILFYSKERKEIPKPIPKNHGLKNIVSNHILNYLHQISIDDIKNLLSFCSILKINYIRELLISYLAHYIYRKKDINFLIKNNFI